MDLVDPVALNISTNSVSLAETTTSPTADLTKFVTYLQQTNTALIASDNAVQRSVTGDNIAPHELMLGLENAKLQLQLLVEIRNRCVEAYQEVMRMQV